MTTEEASGRQNNGKSLVVAYAVAFASVLTAISGPLYLGMTTLHATVLRMEEKLAHHEGLVGHPTLTERVNASGATLLQLDVKLQTEMNLTNTVIKESIRALDETLQREMISSKESMEKLSIINRDNIAQLRSELAGLKRVGVQ